MSVSQLRLLPVHPGEVLFEDFLKPTNMSAKELAAALKVSDGEIAAIINGEGGIEANIALRLARFFGTSEEVWMNLQSRYELEVAKDSLKEAIEREVVPFKT
ncbi:MAG: HigA family addiction module antidote protein [Oscillatoria sp. SIO1A7]|nr:HigA family addiction module antidote protein [Oscillatoria sp. SIO1A7]